MREFLLVNLIKGDWEAISAIVRVRTMESYRWRIIETAAEFSIENYCGITHGAKATRLDHRYISVPLCRLPRSSSFPAPQPA
jgi:hypothetical protein